MHTDGSGSEEIARGTFGGPAWSPDGTRLAFVRCHPVTEDNCMVVVREEDGRERELIGLDYGNPAWSPDGTEIAIVQCVATEDLGCAIFAVPAKGGIPRRVTPNRLFGQPVWSPDGRRIAFDTTPHGIFVVAADGSGVLWSTYALDSEPTWSPDGRQIAFVRSERLAEHEFRHDVYVIAANGEGARRITDGQTSQTNAASPAWSPDGTQLAFVQWTGGGECPRDALFVADGDGSNPRRLTEFGPFHADPTWSPDGRQIAFTRIEECWSEEEATLWLISAEGGEPQAVSPTARPAAGVEWAWRPAP